MKIIQSLTMLLLLVIFVLTLAAWDMQRRESKAPPIDDAAIQAYLGQGKPPAVVVKEIASAPPQVETKIEQQPLSTPSEKVKVSDTPVQGPSNPTNFLDFARLREALVIIETEAGRGSGFIVTHDGKKYIFTNRHVIQGASNILVRTTDGNKLVIKGLELSDSLDAVRFSFEAPSNSSARAISFSTSNPAIGDKISVYGNSQGEGAITRLEGEVLGVGPDNVEVSADFVRGNSGSPILDGRGEVVGIATYCTRDNHGQDWVTSGTRFGDVRRFGVRITEKNTWVPVDQQVYFTQAQLLNRIDSQLVKYFNILCCWLDVPGLSRVEAAGRFSTYVTTMNQLSFQKNPWDVRLKDFAREYLNYWKLKKIRKLADNSLSISHARSTLPQYFYSLLIPLDSALKDTRWLTKSLHDEAQVRQEYVDVFKKVIEQITKREAVFWQDCVFPESLIKASLDTADMMDLNRDLHADG